MNLKRKNGFTLLEVLIVLFILGMIAALAWPTVGMLDDKARERITCRRMEEIRRAVVGDPDRFDEKGRRIIGGYVGDMGRWPDLWEAAYEHIAVDENDTPPYSGGDYTFGFRPAGHFSGERWQWCYPFRKLDDGGLAPGTYDPADPAAPTPEEYCRDHIGGLETENEGQPVALWRDDPAGDGTAAEDSDLWKGPYLVPPADTRREDSEHWAQSESDYQALGPVAAWVWVEDPPPAHWQWQESWEDGDNSPGSEPFDEKEKFRLLQTDSRLADGWGRALRFFITADPDRAGHTILWILSEGPDRNGYYPAKGSCSGHTWTVDVDDTMAKAYDPDHDLNRDNIVMQIHSYEWEAIFETERRDGIRRTEELLRNIVHALAGDAPTGENNGFCGDVCSWPHLFVWEDNGTPADSTDDRWDDEDDSATAYTKGQPRPLWTRQPNWAEPDDESTGDSVAAPDWAHVGIGWRNAYWEPPFGSDDQEVIYDAWDRPVRFFKVKEDAAGDIGDAMLILSAGPDGAYTYGDPDNLIEELNLAAWDAGTNPAGYNPDDAANLDNIVRVVPKSRWQGGGLTVNHFSVLNAQLNVTKAYFFNHEGVIDPASVHTAAVLEDADGDGTADDWSEGLYAASPSAPPWSYDAAAAQLCTGTRALVFWHDDNANDAIDPGEEQYTFWFDIRTAHQTVDRIVVDAAAAPAGQFAPAD